jgi:hypothetical protein
MSALTTHTSNQFRQKRKRKETTEKLKQVIKSRSKANQKPRKDHLSETNLGPLRQGQRLDTTEIKMPQNCRLHKVRQKGLDTIGKRAQLKFR